MNSPPAVSEVNPFSTDPASPFFFAGRGHEISLVKGWLSAIQTQPQHACVVGRQGEGKTSFLQRAKFEANELHFVSCSPRIDAKRSPEQNIHTIIEALLDAIDSASKLKLRIDWKSGKNSSFRTPQESEVRVNDLVKDLQSFLDQLEAAGHSRACLLCVDDGQAIHPSALSTLRNALQDVGAGYMLLMAVRNDSMELTNIIEGPRLIQEFATTSTDAGLPRLFANNFIPLGPFENQQEAYDCISKRLEHRRITFAPNVIRDVGRVTGRYPHTMMILSKTVYSLTQEANPKITEANDEMFRQAFITTQKPLVDAAVDFVAKKSNTRKQVYRATLAYDTVFTPLQIARDMLGSSGTFNEIDFASDPVAVGLEDLVNARFCGRSGNDQYQWSDPLRAHSLRIAVN